MKNQSLLSILLLLCVSAAAHAQSGYSQQLLVQAIPKPTYMVKYYKPTQTYYGNGYVVRYGYTTTNPIASGYTSTYASLSPSADQYLSMANTESRRDITIIKKTVSLPSKEGQQGKRDVQEAPAKKEKPQP